MIKYKGTQKGTTPLGKVEWACFEFECDVCHGHGDLKINTADTGKRFRCPDSACGALYIMFGIPGWGYEIKCALKPQIIEGNGRLVQ